MTKHVFYTSILLLLLISAKGVMAQFEYIFPDNGTINNFRETPLILRCTAVMDPASVTADKIILIGSTSGVVPARVSLSVDDGKTICIKPLVPFAYNESVNVEVKEGLQTLTGQTVNGTSFQFAIRREMTAKEKEHLEEYLSTHDDDGNLLDDPNQQSTYVPLTDNTVRTSPLPFINIYTNNNPTPGQIFFHRNKGNSPTASSGIGYGIMESNGDSVFYRASEVDGANFHINLNGYLTAYRLDPGVDTGIIVLDSGYNIIDVVHCEPSGTIALTPSQHEQLFFPDGSKWFTIYDWQPGWDLSSYGGSTDVTVNVSWIQGLNSTGDVIFMWRSDSHFQITDAAADILNTITQQTFDPWHVNALYKDNDGNIIASFRNMDMIIKLNASNTNIMWYWGGNNSSYFPLVTTTSDPNGGFSHQHNVQRIENGHILLFDNGNLHSPPVSQPKEYVLDETNFTASCFWFYTHPQVNGFNMYTKNQGSVHRLPNQNTIIGYGLPNIQGLFNGTEIDANKNIVWEFRFKDSTEYSYRIYKDTWSPNVGIDEVDISSYVNVFPNPTTGLVKVNIDIPLGDKINISVSNLVGQVIYSKEESGFSGKNDIALDLSQFSKGFYLLHLSSGQRKMTAPVVLQ